MLINEVAAWKLWARLSIAAQKHLLNQFGAEVLETEPKLVTRECWERGRYTHDEVPQFRAWREDLGFLDNGWESVFSDEFEAMDVAFASLVEDYSAGLVVKIMQNPLMSVTAPLHEVVR